MPRRSLSLRRVRRKPARRSRRSRHSRRSRWFKRLSKRLPSKRTRRRIRRDLTKRTSRTWRRAPRSLRWLFVAASIPFLWLAVNGVYQVVRKPSELFFPLSGTLHKSSQETWRAYGSLFRAHSTPVITPEFLAALAQVEASGNPVARTYWRWSRSLNPFSIYRPASSAVGLFQITDGTFEEARRFCIHDHVVVEEGPWSDFDSCWFNALYTRVHPSHATELTSAYLDHHVRRILRRYPLKRPTLRAQHELATVIHLCGKGAAVGLARRGLQVKPGQRCGAHDLRRYLEKVAVQQARFARLAAAE